MLIEECYCLSMRLESVRCFTQLEFYCYKHSLANQINVNELNKSNEFWSN